MRVLVTGCAGYIGSTLVRVLLENGFDVVCLDRFFFGLDSVRDLLSSEHFSIVKDDIRWFDPSILRDVDVVVDLAALSNDPAGELDPSKTLDINYLGRVRVARLSREFGVSKYIFASTCSVYGFQEGLLTEEAKPNPLTTYAKASALAEKDILPLASDDFSVTVLRFATAYGLSYRMRFDLVVNTMTLYLYKHNKIRVSGDGTQWRPLVHVKDISRAILAVIKSPSDVVNGEVFNVGSNDQNYQIIKLAREIGGAIGVPYEIEFFGDPDKRSYRVDFSKIREKLDFEPKYRPRDGAREIYNALKEGRVKDDLRTITVKWYKHLLESHKLVKNVELRDTIL